MDKDRPVDFQWSGLLTDFAEYPHMFGYTEKYFLKAVTKAEPIGLIGPSPYWTEEILDWKTKKDLERPRQRTASQG